jgi:hypothetical protein
MLREFLKKPDNSFQVPVFFVLQATYWSHKAVLKAVKTVFQKESCALQE